MTKAELLGICVKKPDLQIYKETKANWDHLSKPLDGMGDFEGIICQIASILNNTFPDISNRALIVFCADNGIVKHGVTQSEQDITSKVAAALGADISTANCLAKSVNTKVISVDIGINSDETFPGVLDRKIARGTNDFLVKPAMDEEQLLKAVETGIELVKQQKELGTELIATGEMGIGNTTTSAAVLVALLNIDSEECVGRGAGLNDEKLIKKREVVKSGVDKYKEAFDKISDDGERAFEILRCLGGLDIAAMCGVFIGGSLYDIPIVIDGVISAVAALCAQMVVPGVKEFMIASHSGREKGTGIVLDKLDLKPAINGNMALGEGTGALMMMPLLDSALYLYKNGIRFSDAGIEDYERFN